MKKYSLTLMLLISSYAFSQKMQCDDLIQYRDKGLLKIYDKTLHKYRINQTALNDIKKYRKELQEDNAWAASNGAALVVTIKLLCDSFNDIMGAASPQGKVINLIREFDGKALTVNSIKVFNRINDGKSKLDMLISQNVEYEIFKQGLSGLGRVGNVTNFFLNLKDNLQNIQDHSKLKKEVNQQLKQFDLAVSKYQSEMNKAFNNVELLNKYKNYIDKYLSEHCSADVCQWINDLPIEVKKGTRCGKSSSCEVFVINNTNHYLRTFVSFQKIDGSWKKWEYDGTFGKGVAPNVKRNWYTCAGTGKVKVIARVANDNIKCTLPKLNK